MSLIESGERPRMASGHLMVSILAGLVTLLLSVGGYVWHTHVTAQEITTTQLETRVRLLEKIAAEQAGAFTLIVRHLENIDRRLEAQGGRR